ncbi:MAG: diguanylate cyclase [Cellvibrionaceae bacterium]|nr:diguanylate cyclase [Cellvibrionaceae bacterium]
MLYLKAGQKVVLSVFLFFSSLISAVVYAQSVTQVKVVSRGDENADYAIEMIKLGLEKAGRRFELIVQDGALSAPKMREELLAGNIDIIWVATNLDMEQNALPVRVPLYKGLLGHRLLIVHKDNAHLFDRVQSMEDVRRFTYGQGVGWPDTAIMQANGMKVVPATKYEGLFHMVDGKRFDAFPRGIHEPWGEVQKHKELELTVDTNIMLVYTMPYYLFVAPNRPELAADIERGLLRAIDDGSFDEKLFNNPMVQMVLKYSNLKNRRIFKLQNPELPPKTPLDNPKLWLDVSKL